MLLSWIGAVGGEISVELLPISGMVLSQGLKSWADCGSGIGHSIIVSSPLRGQQRIVVTQIGPNS
jgi:hypothetical protein